MRWGLVALVLGSGLLLGVTVALLHALAGAPVHDQLWAQGALRVDNGLELRLVLPPGPYFRTELLPVTLTLTNHTAAPVYYAGSLAPDPCTAGALAVTMMQEGQYLMPEAIPFYPSCPYIPRATHTLERGASLQVRTLLGLPLAGPITLTGQLFFPRGTRVTTPGLLAPDGPLGQLRRIVPFLFRSSHSPFAAGWPSLTITVTPMVPPGHTLHLVRRGHGVYLLGSPRPASVPVGQEAMSYVEGRLVCETGDPTWRPLRANALHDSECRPDDYSEVWQVLIGVPGYAIFSAVYCFNPVPGLVFSGSSCTERIADRGTGR